MPTIKSPNTRYLHLFNGYYIEDCLCRYCKYNKGPKRGCLLEACMFLDEKLDALAHGRIDRKRGAKAWDK